MNQCPFCDLSKIPKPLYTNAHCQIIPDISPLLPGHVLVVPFEHIEGMSRCGEAVFASVLEAVEVALEKYSYCATIFEHGALRDKNAGSSISHAHIHIVPGAIDLTEIIESSIPLESIPLHYKHLNADFLKDKSYLFVQSRLFSIGTCYLVQVLPRQYLRALLLRKLGRPPLFDWEVNSSTTDAKLMVEETIRMWK